MSILDAIKNSVLEGFDTSITATDILLGLGVALLAGLFILLIYRSTVGNMTFNRSFGLTLLLVTSISAMIVLTITANLALSLGMVGALSIVRFRTAIKDASDTAFMFWAVAAGITAGAGFYLLTLIGCLFVGVVCVVSILVLDHSARAYLLVVKTQGQDAPKAIERALSAGKMRYKLSALTQNGENTEVIYELAFTEKNREVVTAVQNIAGVMSLSLVDCRKS